MHEEYLPDGELCARADNEEVRQRELVRVDRHPEHVVLQRLSSHKVNPRPLIGWRTGKAASSLVGNLDEGEIYQTLNDKAGL
jgi:hypothetical protein